MTVFFDDLSAFIGQEYVLNAIACLFFAIMGISFGSILRIVLPLKKNNSGRFISICIFTSLAIILYTILIFFTKELLPFLYFVKIHQTAGFSQESYWIMLFSFFLFSALISCFFKVMLPLFSILSMFFLYGNFYILTSLYGPQKEKLNFKIDDEAVSLDGKNYSISERKNLIFLIDFVTIPPTIPLPLSRSYYSIKKIRPDEASPAAGDPEIILSEECKIPAFYNNPAVFFYINNILLKNKSEGYSVKIPDESFYPVLYTINVSFIQEQLIFKIVKDL
ncbi:MAG: hypothetical protein K5873_07335 [Treponema sp.]|nr:hypothetical protein [Treponema sp.]